jgi:flagellar hook-associated protein 3 FlgL
MRISTLQIFNIANNSIRDASNAIAKTQQQLSSGQRIQTAADDPVSAAKSLELEHSLSRIEQYGKNINLAENSLSLQETTLDSITNLLQRVRELAVGAGNTATLNPEDYDNLATEVNSRIGELQDLMNSRNSSGDYIFAGYKGNQQPFVGTPISGFEFQGSEGSLHMKVSESTSVAAADSGKDIFWNIPAAQNSMRTSTHAATANISIGQIVDQEAYDEFYPKDMAITYNNDGSLSITERFTNPAVSVLEISNYTMGDEIIVNGVSVRLSGTPADGDQFFIDSSSTQDILTTLSRFSAAMTAYDGSDDSKAALTAMVADTLSNIDNTEAVMGKTTASLGARFNTLESMREQHLDSKLYTDEILSEIRDLNYAEAATRLAAQSLILDAAQASFMRVSQLTLFNRM